MIGMNSLRVAQVLICAFTILLAPPSVWAQLNEHLSRLPLPARSQLKWVSQQSQVNGNSISIAEFYSSASLSSTTDFYRALWPKSNVDEGPGMIEVADSEWLYLSKLQSGLNTVIQLRRLNPSVSSGFISVMDAKGCEAQDCFGGNQHQERSGLSPERQPFEHNGSTILSQIESLDDGFSSSLLVLESAEHFQSFSRKWLSNRRNERWRLVLNERDRSGQIIVMQRNGSRLEMVASQSDAGGTVVVVNEVTNEKN